ncbi:hypothetical protein BV22DRAFT_673743 [Leucogyrophana mollusca]|uniref:Uncharacterized protein n=1 Tax=Leucogyrophana mollusca TaxID=85980 RepID=A0ACB8BA99_9AGAM|nr:hypothetical protein BV22DRAFT_673743 [Leucogyrophana mollusca]
MGASDFKSLLSIADISRDMKPISISALSFLFWELCITFDDEVNLIWSKPWGSLVKWLFLLTRYVGLASIASGRALGTAGHSSALSCREALALQVSMTRILFTLVEIILMLRLYALYNRDPRIAAFLVFLAVLGAVVAIVGLSNTVPSSHFDELCHIIRIDTPLSSFSFVFVGTEGVILLLTILKYIHSLHSIRNSTPIVKLMLRDGTLAFCAVTSLLIPTSVLLVVHNGALGSVTNSWYNTVLSSAGCRLILNMQRLSLGDQCESHPNETLPMTSHIEIELLPRDRSIEVI